MVALRKAPLPIQFAGGVETKQDSKQVPSAKLLDLQNATFIKSTTLAKRNGYEALGRAVDGAGGTYGAPRGLGSRDDELLLFDDKRCYSHRESSDTWASAGEVLVGQVTNMTLARSGTDQTQPDVATRNGITVAAWEDSRGGVWCSVLEDVTGRILVSQQQLDVGGALPRVLAVGEVIHILWVTMPNIMVAVVNPANPEAPLASSILTSDLDPTNPVYDAEPTLAAYSIDRPGVVAWAVRGGYRVGYLAAPGVLGSPLYGLPSVGTGGSQTDGAISVTFDRAGGSGIVVGYSPGNAIRCAVHQISAPTTVLRDVAALANFGLSTIRLTGEITNGVWTWAAEKKSPTTHTQFVRSSGVAVATGTPTGVVADLRGHSITSRAFVDGADVYVAVVHPVRFFPYVAVARLTAAAFGGTNTTCVARLLPGLSVGMLLRNHLPSVSALDIDNTATASRIHGIPLSYRIQLSSENGDQFAEQGIRLAELDLGGASYRSVQLGRGLYLAGAVPLHYDGARWAEADFHAAPDYGFDFTISGAPALAALTPADFTFDGIVTLVSGGSITPATYLYKLWYEEIDAQGELHPGAVSVPVTVVMNDDFSAVQLLIPTCRLTSKRFVRIGVGRSPGNQTGDPESIPFYRVSSIDPTDPQYNINDPTTDYLTFVDTLSDADLLTKEPLYTNGGILSNDPPAMAGGVIAGGKSRLFWTDPDDGNLVRFSQQLRDDTSAELCDALSVRVDPYGGAIVALAVMDDAVIVLRETALHGFVGPGPDADGDLSGSTDAFSPPQLITGDVGCIAPGSVVQSPLGVCFQSAKGIMLLGRDRQVQRIGDPVYAYNDQTIVRATLLPDRPQIVFLTNAGRTLLWDYERNQWSTYTNHEGIDGIVVDGVYNYLRNDGRVFRETPGVYADDNSHIPMRIETAWVKAAGYLQGWQRIYHALVLGTWKSSHTLSLRYKIDYQEAWSAPLLADVDGDYNPSLYGAGRYGVGDFGGPGGASGTVYQRRFHINKRCQSIAFRIEDVEPTSTFGAAFELSEMLLTGGILGPAFQPGATRSG